MKKIFGIFGVLIISAGLTFAQEVTTAPKDTAVITFEKSVYDFGSLKPGSHTFEFSYVNTGKGPLVLTNVAPGCGCTKADWSKEPLKPGEKAVIKATYTASSVGPIQKGITIYSNAKNSVVSISFKATVISPAENTSQAETTTTQEKKN
jgi:ABC-type molybdate transport system substrate-binding protein